MRAFVPPPLPPHPPVQVDSLVVLLEQANHELGRLAVQATLSRESLPCTALAARLRLPEEVIRKYCSIPEVFQQHQDQHPVLTRAIGLRTGPSSTALVPQSGDQILKTPRSWSKIEMRSRIFPLARTGGHLWQDRTKSLNVSADGRCAAWLRRDQTGEHSSP